MKLALVADLHGNKTALAAMEQELRHLKPDQIWFLGDAVGKGPSNAETTDWVRANCTRCVGGNWDYGIGRKQFEGDAYFWDQLGAERMRFLADLPAETEAWISGRRFRFFHGRPVHELLFAQSESEKITPTFRTDHGTFDAVCFADSHRPFFRTMNTGYFMNTGSVGNSMGVNNVHFLLVEGNLDSREKAPLYVTVVSLPYDNEAEAAIARRDPALPHQAEYLREILTGEYAR